ncbi:MAG: nuclear transport factor 2 family protein [Bacteroidales bacterium]|jgi:ketosteroid isomerase-like protein|nr:nuclear transport factor 2 family protein [Bacteroidales bacterium]
MKNRVIGGALLLSALLSMNACCTKKTESAVPAVDMEQIKKEIQAKENEFAEIFNSGEIKNIGYYADDAVSFAQNRPAMVGKDAIVEYYRANLDTLSQNKISFTTNEVFVQNDGSLVVEIGYYKVVDPSAAVVNSGNYISIFEKRDGRYVCIRDMSTSDLPLNLE